jgi:hypothetical protein
MVKKVCVVKNCELTDEMRIFRTHHKVPSNEVIRNLWKEKIPYLSPDSFVCDRHFLPKDYGTGCLRRSAVPSQNLTIDLPEGDLLNLGAFNNYDFQDEMETIDGKVKIPNL